MTTKPTLQEKLAKRKFTLPNPFIYFLYRVIMSGFVSPKYRPHYVIKDKVSDCKGPCFVIWNHLSRLDHAFVLEACWPRRVNILAGYNEFFRSHLAMVFKLNSIIPKKNYVDDMNSVRAMNSIVKQGGCLAFAPEGMSSIYGTNQPIVPGTGRFLQFYRIPVYFVKIAGSYLTSTKVCQDERPGRVDVELSLLFTPEQLDSMTPQQIDDKLNEVFSHDDYQWSYERGLKWKTHGTVCKKLDDICYKCPRCGEDLRMKAQDDWIRCTTCGNGARMDDYYRFQPFDDKCVIPESPAEWVKLEREAIKKEIRENPDFSFSCKVKIGDIPKYHLIRNHKTSELCGEGVITFDHEGIHFDGEKRGEPWHFDISYSMQFSLPIVTDTSYFSLYVNHDYYDILPDEPCVGKMLLLTEEMHRLHFNIWKSLD